MNNLCIESQALELLTEDLIFEGPISKALGTAAMIGASFLPGDKSSAGTHITPKGTYKDSPGKLYVPTNKKVDLPKIATTVEGKAGVYNLIAAGKSKNEIVNKWSTAIYNDLLGKGIMNKKDKNFKWRALSQPIWYTQGRHRFNTNEPTVGSITIKIISIIGSDGKERSLTSNNSSPNNLKPINTK